MSLIGDALRKTRQEAAERESDRKGVLFSAKIANPPTRSNLGLGLALGAIIAVAATVAGGGAVWWILSRGETGHPAADEKPSPVTAEAVEGGRTAPDPLPTLPVESETQTRDLPSTETDPIPTTGTDSGGTESQNASARPQRVIETPIPSPPETGNSEGRFVGVEDGADVYILEADLGAVKLSLDYIIFRSEDPFAEINGVELHLGGVIEGFRVKAIERDRVHLSNGIKDIILRAP